MILLAQLLIAIGSASLSGASVSMGCKMRRLTPFKLFYGGLTAAGIAGFMCDMVLMLDRSRSAKWPSIIAAAGGFAVFLLARWLTTRSYSHPQQQS